MTKKRLTLLILLLISTFVFSQVSSQKAAESKILYPNLEKGKYEIGYKTITDFDYSRTYNLKYPADTNARSNDPRPMIINIWYPATKMKKAKSMVYLDYIKIKSQNPDLKNFIKRIEDYNADNSKQYMFYKDSLNETQIKDFTKHLNQSLNVYRDAKPVNSKFPLVLYHAGLGGTLNDNTILCEYLASHGFVVVTGAFQSNDYESVSLDWDLERSSKDMDFILNSIKNLSFIDFSKIAALGHSYGAQAVLGYKTEDFSPISLLLILDSTFDYSVDANPDGFEPLTEKLYRKIRNINVPMLVFANPGAMFKVADSLKYADRTYATIELSHNEFTSLTSFAVMKDLQKRNDKDTVWNKYILINKFCLNFLKQHFYKDSTARNFMFSKHEHLKAVYYVEKGKSLNKEIPEYKDFSNPPTYLQVQKLLVDKRKDILEIVFEKFPESLNEDDVNNMGYKFIKKDTDFAIFLFQKNVVAHPLSWNVYDSLGDGYTVKGEKKLAIENYKKSLELNPENENGIRMLKKLGVSN